MLSPDLDSLILDSLSWNELEQYGLTHSDNLLQVQRYFIRNPKRVNHLAVLLRLLPEAGWNKQYLGQNASLTQTARSNDEWALDEWTLTWQIVYQNPENSWDFNELSRNMFGWRG